MDRERRIFHSKYQKNPVPLTILMVVLILALCLGIVLPFGLTTSQLRSGQGIVFFLLHTPLGFLLGLAVMGIGYAGAYLWYEALIFDRNEFSHRSIPLPFISRRAIKYDQIVRVRHSMRGLLVIEAANKNSMIIRVDGYEVGWKELVQEISYRIGDARLSAETREKLWERTNADRWSLGLAIVALALFSVSIGWSYFHDRGRAGIAWNVAASRGYGSGIVDYANAQDGSLWLLVRGGLPLGEDERYQVTQHLNGTQNTWVVPVMSDLLPLERERYTYPSQVLVDVNGNPWLHFRFLNRILYLRDGGWEWLPIPQGTSQGYVEEFVPSDGAFWGNQNDELLVLEPGELAAWKVPGFSVVQKPELTLYETPVSSLAVAFFSSGKTLISRLTLTPSGLEWSEVLIQEGMKPLQPQTTWATASIWGNLYLMTWSGMDCSEGETIVQIGTLVGDETWSWFEAGVPHDCETSMEVQGLLVDPRERVWIATDVGLWIFDYLDSGPNTLPRASLVEYYTEKNSGYFQGDLGQDSEGRIWTLDRNGHYLVWLDGHSLQLPRPLPKAFSIILGSEWMPLILQYLGILAILGIFMVLWDANRYKATCRDQNSESTA